MTTTLLWFRPTRFRDRSLDEIRTILAPLGVIERSFSSFGWGVYYEPDPDEPGRLVKAVGEVIVRPDCGAIEVWPYTQSSDNEKRALYGTAEQMFTEKPSKREGWDFNRRPQGKSYWRTTIFVEVSEGDQWHRLIAANALDARRRRETADLSGVFAQEQTR